MVFLLDIAAVHRVGVRLLAAEGEQYRALVSKNIYRVAAPDRDIDESQCRRRTGALIGRVHQREGEGFPLGHTALLMPDRLRPNARSPSRPPPVGRSRDQARTA